MTNILKSVILGVFFVFSFDSSGMEGTADTENKKAFKKGEIINYISNVSKSSEWENNENFGINRLPKSPVKIFDCNSTTERLNTWIPQNNIGVGIVRENYDDNSNNLFSYIPESREESKTEFILNSERQTCFLSRSFSNFYTESEEKEVVEEEDKSEETPISLEETRRKISSCQTCPHFQYNYFQNLQELTDGESTLGSAEYSGYIQQNLFNIDIGENRTAGILRQKANYTNYSLISGDPQQISRLSRAAGISKYSSSPHLSPFPVLEDYSLTRNRIILSFDGGGSRGGRIESYLVYRLNEALGGQLLQAVDMIAGTSCGALVGASLLAGTSGRLYETFPDVAREIFQPRWGTFGGYYRPKYGDEGKWNVINRFLDGYELKYAPKDDNKIKKVVVPFLSETTQESIVFENFGPTYYDFEYSDVLMLTSAAPTYFDPYRCKLKSDPTVIFEGLDGGLFANNPSKIAYEQMRKLYPDDHIIVLRLGSGRSVDVNAIGEATNRSALYWASKLVDFFMAASENNTHRRLIDVAENGDNNMEYLYIQPLLEKSLMLTDITDDDAFNALIEITRRCISKHGSGQSYDTYEKMVAILRNQLKVNERLATTTN